MNTIPIKSFTNKIIPIDEAAWEVFEQYFSLRILNKGEILWRGGDICKHIVFLNKGLIRVYYFSESDGKEITSQFFFENSYLTDYVSLISRQPCRHTYEALEETELIIIPRIGLYEMYDKFKFFERFGRLMAERSYLKLREVSMNLKMVSPEEKYLKILRERPKVIQRVPLKMIASYIGVSPEHLSRIRKKIR